jgi:MYXO-CTERM domain-containing protein
LLGTAVAPPAAADTTVRVLIYNGYDASGNCVNGTRTCLDEANDAGWVAGVRFSHATSTSINSSTLSGYDVVVLPGGDSGRSYLDNSNISGGDLRGFVRGGGGYFGTCAGAYAAVEHVDEYYDGWGLTPGLRAEAVEYIGDLPIVVTAEGEAILGRSGTVTVHHYRGAAMYESSAGPVHMATYGDGSTGYDGYLAVAGTAYGAGRTVLAGPHPELEPRRCDVVARLVAWAAGFPEPPPEDAGSDAGTEAGGEDAGAEAPRETVDPAADGGDDAGLGADDLDTADGGAEEASRDAPPPDDRLAPDGGAPDGGIDDDPPALDGLQGGCGCAAPGSARAPGLPALAAPVMLAAFTRRRRSNGSPEGEGGPR